MHAQIEAPRNLAQVKQITDEYDRRLGGQFARMADLPLFECQQADQRADAGWLAGGYCDGRRIEEVHWTILTLPLRVVCNPCDEA